MKNREMHCHSTLSDGKNTPYEVIAEAQRVGVGFLALTDHDIISSKEFQSNLRDIGIMSCDSVEISARNYDVEKSLHLVSYAKTFSDSLHEVLQHTRNGKGEKNKGQIEKLITQFGFVGTYQGFIDFMKKKRKRNIETANGFDISCYMMGFSENQQKVEMFLDVLLPKDGKNIQECFFSECLKRGGQLFDIYGYEIAEYEPSVEQTVEEVVIKSGGIVSLAHPNVTFSGSKGGISEFKRTIGDYVEKGVNAIEINTQANAEWIQTILNTQQRYDLILTFGSDCHQIGYDGRDKKHASMGERNPRVSEEVVEEHFYRFQNTLNVGIEL